MRFKFVGKTSTSLMFTRRYGRAPGGRRLNQAMPLRNGPTVTVVATLTPQGVEAVMGRDGAVNTTRFT